MRVLADNDNPLLFLMTKNTLYLVLGVVVLVLLGAWFYFKGGTAPAPAPVSTTTAAIGASAQTGDTVKTGVPSAVGKTNPFQSNVNPMSGYQNPFGQ